MMPGNPLNMGLSSDGLAEVQGVYTDHIPVILAGVLIGAALVLIGLDKADFKFAGAGSIGR